MKNWFISTVIFLGVLFFFSSQARSSTDIYDFSYTYKDPYEAHADDYIVSVENAVLQTEGDVTYWKQDIGSDMLEKSSPGVIIYRFDFDQPVKEVDLMLRTSTFHWAYSQGHSYIYASPDGVNWNQLVEAEPPAFGGANTQVLNTFPDSLLGGTSLWFKIELFSYGSSAGRGGAMTNTAQHSRYSKSLGNTTFSLNVNFSNNTDEPADDDSHSDTGELLVCSPENPDLCKTSSDCLSRGNGFWCNSACSETPCDTAPDTVQCLPYNISANGIVIDTFFVGGGAYKGSLNLYSITPLLFELTDINTAVNTGDQSAWPSYDLFSNLFHFPCVKIGDLNFTIDFKIVSFDPILFEITGFTPTDGTSPQETHTTVISAAERARQIQIDDGLTISIPAGLFDEETKLTVIPKKSYPSLPAPEDLAGQVYDIAFSSDELNHDVTLEFMFDPERLPSDVPPEAVISVAHYNEKIGEWIYWPKKIDVANGKIQVETKEFSMWAWWYVTLSETGAFCSEHFCLYHINALSQVTFKNGDSVPMREIVSDLASRLEESRKRYARAGFTVPDYLNVNIYESSDEPHYASGWIGQDTIYLSLTNQVKESHDILRQTAAHELFHAVQNQHVNAYSMGYFERQWFTEATADFAAFHVAGQRQSGKLRDLNASFFSDPLSTFDGVHEYQAAHFIDYLVTQENISFLDMFMNLYQPYFTTAVGFLEQYLPEKTGKTTRDIWDSFVQSNYLKNLSLSNPSYYNVASNFSSKNFSLDLMNGYTADSLLLRTQDQISLKIKPDSLNVSLDGLYNNWAKLYIYKISNFREEETKTISLLNAFDKENIAPVSQFTMDSNDRVLVLAVYDRIDMPPVRFTGGIDKYVKYVKPDQNLRLDLSVEKKEDETPENPDTNAIVSTFDGAFVENVDRWGIGPMAPGFADRWFQAKDVAAYHQTGGNPDGFISWVGAQGDWWFFSTDSTKYRGDRSAAYGKKITFDLKTENTKAPDYSFLIPFVLISGTDTAGNPLHIFQPQSMFGQAHHEEPGTSWTGYAINLDASAGWKVTGRSSLTGSSDATETDIRQVLSTLTSLRIRGEYGSSGTKGALDNVVFGGSF